MNTTSHLKPSALPPEWVERIFAHMACLYGSRFADLWAVQDATTVKAFWSAKLGGFASHPQAIKAALEALDDLPNPPTLPQFIALCRNAIRRQPANLALPQPQIDHTMALQRLAACKQMLMRGSTEQQATDENCEVLAHV